MNPAIRDIPDKHAEQEATRIQDVLDKVTSHRSDADAEAIRRAYVFAAAMHVGQVRLSGEPYLSHPLTVADILVDMYMDDVSVIAGLLHDTVEDTAVTVDDIDQYFGEEVADVVNGVTKISLLNFDSKEEQQAENIRKMILAMSMDIRVIIVKLADRLHNMRTLQYQPSEKQQRIARETMDIYAPLANRMGLHRIKLELEDLSFRYLRPDAYAQIRDWLDRHSAADNKYIAEVIIILNNLIADGGIAGQVKGRIKHCYSIHRKQEEQKLDLADMHDIIAFRVIVTEKKDCYAVLGLVHAAWKPVPGRFKDYISMPKSNMYQSLHTTVAGPGGERMEIQIRTAEMDELAENGLASHWLYKEGDRVKARDVENFQWLREMLDWQKEESDSKEFLHTLRLDLFKEEIYVFTPQGEVKELPDKATPVDFAYHIHSKIGDHCSGAKVNDRLVPLNTPLKSGDYVQILTDANRHPSKDWLKFVKTAKARSRISHYVRTEQLAQAVHLGRDILEKQGRRLNISFHKAIKEITQDRLLKEYNLKNLDGLFAAVYEGRFKAHTVLRFIRDQLAEAQNPTVPPVKTAPLVRALPSKSAEEKKEESITIGGADLPYTFARCCHPVPGDQIVGYTSIGRGLIVHTAACQAIANVDPERLISAHWGDQEEQPFPVSILIKSRNDIGVLNGITRILLHERINIDSGQIHSNVESKSEITLIVKVKNTVQLYQVIARLRALPSVNEVSRHSWIPPGS